jgi:hypothetical protein
MNATPKAFLGLAKLTCWSSIAASVAVLRERMAPRSLSILNTQMLDELRKRRELLLN